MNSLLADLDAKLAPLLARRIEILATEETVSLDEQLAAAPTSENIPPALWRALLAHTTAEARLWNTPPYAHEPRRITIVGGRGAMAGLLAGAFERHGHHVTSLDADDWSNAPSLLGDADLALVAVPIDATDDVIRAAARHLAPDALLADVTSLKVAPVAAMLQAHSGPVLGLHPMFGPHVTSLLAQRVVACCARDPGAARWLLDLFRFEGAVVVESTPEEHDRMMIAVQAVRHFTTFALGVFLAEQRIDVPRSLDFASPIYRLEIDIVSRLFAQSPDLYLSIMSAAEDRRDAVTRLAATFSSLADALASHDHDALREAFARTARHLGAEAPRALDETTLAVEALSTALAARSG